MRPRETLKQGQRVLVVGAGVVGLCVARELVGRGFSVSVLESNRVGAGASAAAVGVLQAPPRGQSAFAGLRRQGYESYPELVHELQLETSVDIGYREYGCVHLLEESPLDPEAEIAAWREVGVGANLLTRDFIGEVIPGFGGRFDCGLELDREAVVHPARLLEALRVSCVERGVELREEVAGLEIVPRGARGVEVHVEDEGLTALSDDEKAALTVVLSAGCWSGLVARRLPGQSLNVRPVRGQAIEIRYPAPRRIIHFVASFNGKGYFLVPRGEDLVWVGSTVEEVGFDDVTTEAGRKELLAAASEVLLDLREELVVRHWAGLRPKAMRRGGPFLGPWPGLSNLWVACGHYRSGILTGPASARLLADAMTGGESIPQEFVI